MILGVRISELFLRGVEPVLEVLRKDDNILFIHNIFDYRRFYLKLQHRFVHPFPELGLLGRAFGKVKLAN